MTGPLVGIFVGGKATRMGGVAKGLLPVDGEPIIVRLVRLASELGLECVLVGRADAYDAVLPQLARVQDAPADVGPLGGLGGLLEAAAGSGRALALACDMPRLSRDLLERLATPCEADVHAPRGSSGKWEPLCAAYDAAVVYPALYREIARGVRSFQALFATLAVRELALSDHERTLLVDWDRPEDIPR